jgi:large subunit ribosomal protein L21
MYAIVEIAGQQFKVAKDQKVFVHRLNGEEGASMNFDNVLLIDNDGTVQVGAPAIDGAQVSAKILRHLKGDKVIVFKKKRRKGYKKKNGHRQYLSEVVIESISASGSKPKAKSTETESKPAQNETAAVKETAKKAASPKAEASDYSAMTVAELKAVAKEKGITGISAMKKAELIAAIQK